MKQRLSLIALGVADVTRSRRFYETLGWRASGARILKPAHETFWGGHAGYFADPDGHPWEVAWNPHSALDADGGLRLPD